MVFVKLKLFAGYVQESSLYLGITAVAEFTQLCFNSGVPVVVMTNYPPKYLILKSSELKFKYCSKPLSHTIERLSDNLKNTAGFLYPNIFSSSDFGGKW